MYYYSDPYLRHSRIMSPLHSISFQTSHLRASCATLAQRMSQCCTEMEADCGWETGPECCTKLEIDYGSVIEPECSTKKRKQNQRLSQSVAEKQRQIVAKRLSHIVVLKQRQNVAQRLRDWARASYRNQDRQKKDILKLSSVSEGIHCSTVGKNNDVCFSVV